MTRAEFERLIAALEVAVKASCEGGWWTKTKPVTKTVHALAVERSRAAVLAAFDEAKREGTR